MSAQVPVRINTAKNMFWNTQGHPAIETCSLATLRVNGHFCGVTQPNSCVRVLYLYDEKVGITDESQS
jgi:hypothetical protein